ncbi:DUF4055 domain-containing protein [Sphingobium sp. HT1-2]|uniref:DUF4055 domain-containing protein n=1 Tax=Sphingobium sp. HT1-2 TaxID=3111640 RepID=UPI003BFD304C
MYKINEPTKEIEAWHDRWKRNRDFVAGEDAVKAEGLKYLPKARIDDTTAEYEDHKQRTGFFPAAFKIIQGWSGLIYRKPAKRTIASARVQLLSQLVTQDNRSMLDVSQWLTRETMTTNFTGSLTDHPSRNDFPEFMSANDELRLGYRPYEALYAAENILEVTRGVLNPSTVGIVHVRLLENDGKRVRQLLINEAGFYEVVIWEKTSSGDFVETSRVSPSFNGQLLTEIPFSILNTDDSIVPTPALIQHCVDLNLQHYIAEGCLSAAIHLTSGPHITITGFEPEIDQKTNKPIDPFTGLPTDKISFPVAPGAVWAFKSQDTEVNWNTYDPKGQELTVAKLRDLKDAMSAIGHSILAPEKPAPEATETQLIRRAAENAMLADFTLKVSKQQEKIWQRFASVADPKNPGLTFELNVDFTPMPMDAQRITALSALAEKRQLSLQTLHEALSEGEIMPHGFTPEQEAERLAQEAVDRPPVL